jgi:DedD protein
MGLFSFGNKDASTTSGRGNSASGAASGRTSRRSAERAERGQAAEGLRRRRSGEPADANMLDPTLPEKQRARRRLIGAIALVLAAVVILPMVLDSHPKPATDGIAIEIPAHDDTPAPSAPSQSSTTAYEAAAGDDDTVANAASTAPAATDGIAAPAPASAGAGTKAADARKNPTNLASNAGSATGQKGAANTGAADKSGGADASADTKTTMTTAAKAPTANDAPPAGSHFVVQIGSFSADAPAQVWVTKLKAAGVPAYVQHSRQDDGSDRVLVRAGPFADRAAAEAAVRKVRTVDAPVDAGVAPGAQGQAH